jgi:ribose 5-phosphate isomerase A
MLVGLGSGSTAQYFIEGLGQRVREGLKVRAVATSVESRRQALAAGITVVESTDRPIDLAVDGADQIDPERNCLKGRGGAMLREKIVARSGRSFVLIADESKLVKELSGPVPVEVLAFLWESTARLIEETGGRPELRRGKEGPFLTDNGNPVLDVTFPSLGKLDELARNLQAVPGVLGHGLFLGMASAAIVAGAGGIRVLGTLP